MHVVHDELTYNDTTLTRDQFANLLHEDVRTIPDLRYEVRSMVADDARIAARLWFSCTPRRPFRGVDTGGRRVAFAERVFYELVDGRIRKIDSLIDVDSVRQQASQV